MALLAWDAPRAIRTAHVLSDEDLSAARRNRKSLPRATEHAAEPGVDPVVKWPKVGDVVRPSHCSRQNGINLPTVFRRPVTVVVKADNGAEVVAPPCSGIIVGDRAAFDPNVDWYFLSMSRGHCQLRGFIERVLRLAIDSRKKPPGNDVPSLPRVFRQGPVPVAPGAGSFVDASATLPFTMLGARLNGFPHFCHRRNSPTAASRCPPPWCGRAHQTRLSRHGSLCVASPATRRPRA